ncbi:hypothetical protein EOA25_41480, partial [Mesorhizobium sp. M2A.F.Ca.ET.040.01.1.1]
MPRSIRTQSARPRSGARLRPPTSSSVSGSDANREYSTKSRPPAALSIRATTMADFDHYELWDTHTLLGVFRELDIVPSYWLDLLFPNEMSFTDEYVDLEKIPRAGRKLAPFVAPMAQGRAIYEEGARVERFKPGYVKPSDP